MSRPIDLHAILRETREGDIVFRNGCGGHVHISVITSLYPEDKALGQARINVLHAAQEWKEVSSLSLKDWYWTWIPFNGKSLDDSSKWKNFQTDFGKEKIIYPPQRQAEKMAAVIRSAEELCAAFEEREPVIERNLHPLIEKARTVLKRVSPWAVTKLADEYSALGFKYANGDGVAQDYKKSVLWYRKAAEQGNTAAQNNLGVFYENGQGVSKNQVAAYALYHRANENQPTESRGNNCRSAAEKLTPAEIKAGVGLSQAMADPAQMLKALDQYLSSQQP